MAASRRPMGIYNGFEFVQAAASPPLMAREATDQRNKTPFTQSRRQAGCLIVRK